MMTKMSMAISSLGRCAIEILADDWRNLPQRPRNETSHSQTIATKQRKTPREMWTKEIRFHIRECARYANTSPLNLISVWIQWSRSQHRVRWLLPLLFILLHFTSAVCFNSFYFLFPLCVLLCRLRESCFCPSHSAFSAFWFCVLCTSVSIRNLLRSARFHHSSTTDPKSDWPNVEERRTEYFSVWFGLKKKNGQQKRKRNNRKTKS